MKQHLAIQPDNHDFLKIIKALIGTFQDWENSENSFKQQLALRELKAVMKSAESYCKALYDEGTNQGKDHADGPQSGGQESNKESTDNPESPVLQAPADGEPASTV